MTIHEPSRRERKKDETRTRIFEAAIALFQERGFEATTVDDITGKADVARGTFFNYFPRKESIFAYMAEEHVETVRQALPALLDSDAPTVDVIVHTMQLGAQRYMTDREVSRMIFAEWVKRDVSPAPDAEASARGLMRRVLERGRLRGELRHEVDEVRANAILKGVFLATLFQWLYCDEECPEHIDDLNAELSARIHLAFDGLAPRAEVRS